MALITTLANAAALAPPGASFGTAYKGCYTNCSDATGDTSWWPYDKELQIFEHNCDATGADAVCVMEHGRCTEYGAPHELLQCRGSAFTRLVVASGEEKELRGMAEARVPGA